MTHPSTRPAPDDLLTGRVGARPSEGLVVLRLTANASHVRTARLVAAAVARRAGATDSVLDDVRQAVGEACARAVRLHERHAIDAPIRVELANRSGIEAVVIDRAPDSGARLAADGVIPAVTGNGAGSRVDFDALGLAVLAGVVDELRVEPNPGGGVRVRMRWPART